MFGGLPDIGQKMSGFKFSPHLWFSFYLCNQHHRGSKPLGRRGYLKKEFNEHEKAMQKAIKIVKEEIRQIKRIADHFVI